MPQGIDLQAHLDTAQVAVREMLHNMGFLRIHPPHDDRPNYRRYLYSAKTNAPSPPRYILHTCLRPNDKPSYKHLERFIMLELVLLNTDMQKAIDLAFACIATMTKSNLLQLVHNAKTYNFQEIADAGRIHVGLTRTCKVTRNGVETELMEEQRENILALDSAYAGMMHDEAAKQHPGCLQVLKGVPPNLDVPTEARAPDNTEIYTRHAPDAYPMELANIYRHNRDRADLTERGYDELLPIPQVDTIDVGIGVERCLMWKLGEPDIKRFAPLTRLTELP